MSLLDRRAGNGVCTEREPSECSVHGARREVVPDFVTVIAQQCRRNADADAVIAADRRLTYRDLANRVTRLAHLLGDSGVGADSLVAICMPRGADELSAMLAVLTLGAAYVPLDPTQPASRLTMVLEDAQPDVVITKHHHPVMIGGRPIRTVVIDEPAEEVGSPPDTWWSPMDAPDALAYVLFTSGSTGRPKGVEIPRRAVSNLIASMVRTPGLRESDVMLSVATTMFDMSVLDLFGPLSVGATLVIVDPEVIKDGRRLCAVLEREKVSVMQATPTMWHMLVDSGWVGDGRLRMLVGGEPLTRDLARQLSCRGELWNMYGPTETTVWSTCKRIEQSNDITIGWPIDNTAIYVLDGNGGLVPPGVAGELYIGGAGLARGYLGRPDLTAERFIENPVGEPGDRIYRTGDLVRLLDSGECEYLGRIDHQVKIRGFRIELGEIEHALGELDCINRAVVIKWDPTGGTPMLVAYVVPSRDSQFDPRVISRLLRNRLPEYMIPGRYIEMSSFPLTPNKKIDRGQLPDPGEVADILEQGPRTGPCTDTEKTLHRIWSEVLARPHIAVEDDFLDLGGQSVLAVKICDRIHRSLAVDLPVSALLDQRTIRELASYIDGLHSGSESQEWSSVVPVQPNGSRTPIFCVSGIGGNPMTFMDLADALGPDQPFYGMQHRGVDGKRTPHHSIEAMAQEFIDDILSVQTRGPYILAGYSGGGLAAYEAARRLVEAGEEVALLVLFDTVRPGVDEWSSRERMKAHWANAKAGGIRYVARRIADRTVRVFDATKRRIRAGLAAFAPYRFRLDAVEMAGRKAGSAYAPQPYTGDVLLFQSDPDIGREGEISLKQHESNGWRDLLAGHLEVISVRAHHLDIVEDTAGRFVASEVNRALASKTQTREGTGE